MPLLVFIKKRLFDQWTNIWVTGATLLLFFIVKSGLPGNDNVDCGDCRDILVF